VQRENERPGSTDWRIPTSRVASDDELSGYADEVSVTSGDTFRLFVSLSAGDVTVRAYRLGWYQGDGARLVWSSDPLPARVQPKPQLEGGNMVVARWRPSVTVPTDGWPDGTYLLLLEGHGGAADGKGKYVPITVRSSSTEGRLVLLNAVTTYQAYNTWGGYSLYQGPAGARGDRALRVSFDRPYDGNGAVKLFSYELGVIQLAERLGLPLAYATSLDIDRRPQLLDGATGLVSMGHDEYWSPGMRRSVEKARDAGTNLAFLGANAVYWRVRFEPDGSGGEDREMVGYRSSSNADPVQDSRDTTAMWRQRPQSSPENSLTGQLYECFPAQGPLVVTEPDFFLFRGTGAMAGESYPGLVGTEIDRAYPIAGTPENLQVIAHSPVSCANRGLTHSDMTYYTTDSGAGVVNTGTMLWVRALLGLSGKHGIDERSVRFATTVTENLLEAMAAGPMGRDHPARGNLDELSAPQSTGTGTGGAYSLSD
jgi:hypothetical protein